MRQEQEIREVLILNTIGLIAEGGFEKATTKAITHSGETYPGIKMNEVYIYRLFGSKEGLYAAAFERLDREVFLALRRNIGSCKALEADTKGKLHEIFCRAWRFLLRNEDRCRCYVRYYHSAYFKDESLKQHNLLFSEIVDEFSAFFKEQADVTSIMHCVFTTMLDFAIRVYNGDLEDNETNSQHIFNVVYCMMMTYLNDSADLRV